VVHIIFLLQGLLVDLVVVVFVQVQVELVHQDKEMQVELVLLVLLIKQVVVAEQQLLVELLQDLQLQVMVELV
tara:strand:+ start:177 stop:395 length:219 start_codon:yes stop_codon:yes gene_type:complete